MHHRELPKYLCEVVYNSITHGPVRVNTGVLKVPEGKTNPWQLYAPPPLSLCTLFFTRDTKRVSAASENTSKIARRH